MDAQRRIAELEAERAPVNVPVARKAGATNTLGAAFHGVIDATASASSTRR